MDTSKYKLVIGLTGIALLLVSVLIYAQVNAAHNYELPEYTSGSRLPSVTAEQE